MRRFAAIAFLLAATLAAARADSPPPPPQLADVEAGDLVFLVVVNDDAAPAHPTAELVACAGGRPNCALAAAQKLIGRRVVGFDGVAFVSDRPLRDQILAAFADPRAPATIAVDFAPEAGEAPLRMTFARR